MANSFFRFKEFTIHQDQCGMKVTTDGCLFGAIIAEHLQQTKAPETILDIGTGTGLLSLMMAQVVPGHIHAIEIDEQASKQAASNFENSPWSEQLKLGHTSFEDFLEKRDTATGPDNTSAQRPLSTYDLIVSNPPFFSHHLKGKDMAKNKALHDEGSLLKLLPAGVNALLSPNGLCFVLLPDYEMSVFTEEMKKEGLFPQQEVTVYHKAGKPPFRRIGAFGRNELKSPKSETLHIHQGAAPYSERFTELLSPYYLHL